MGDSSGIVFDAGGDLIAGVFQRHCMKCPCYIYIETRGQIGDQKMAFYVCRAFNRVLATHGISDICVDRCQECKDAEITKDTESAE